MAPNAPAKPRRAISGRNLRCPYRRPGCAIIQCLARSDGPASVPAPPSRVPQVSTGAQATKMFPSRSASFAVLSRNCTQTCLWKPIATIGKMKGIQPVFGVWVGTGPLFSDAFNPMRRSAVPVRDYGFSLLRALVGRFGSWTVPPTRFPPAFSKLISASVGDTEGQLFQICLSGVLPQALAELHHCLLNFAMFNQG